MSIRITSELPTHRQPNPPPEEEIGTAEPTGSQVVTFTPSPEAPPVIHGVSAVSPVQGADFMMASDSVATGAAVPVQSNVAETTGETVVVHGPATAWVRRDTGAKYKVGEDERGNPIYVKAPPRWVLARVSPAEQTNHDVRQPRADGDVKSS